MKKEFVIPILALPLTLCAGFSLVLKGMQPATAQRLSRANDTATAINQIVFLENFDPPGSGAPPTTKGAGSRNNNSCIANAPSIESLMPQRNYALTMAERPVIFLRVPPQQRVSQAILTFRDQHRQIHAQVSLPLAPITPSAPSPQATISQLVQLQLPTTMPPLEIGKNYRWSVVLVCGKTPQPDDPILSGWVQRVPRQTPPTSHQSVLQKAQWHARQGRWYDLLTTLWNQADPVQPAWQRVIRHYVTPSLHRQLPYHAADADSVVDNAQ
ncbi:DUF928 domain-containing protein [filamentous cyanobacterium LEGE 11480]|uniref:DUF928 domain-containing protein n=1 Tax=Romeriopsis navalis LEGE 11480 TaxID=2777977 RepID=A0A928VR28_9CYAN|nr:DUF928 domain-containing protein [Romeriopsis navalis]MBE9031030.1 DUF928 domain-containing protein [Romeriopsis navalis LEGE 11480]